MPESRIPIIERGLIPDDTTASFQTDLQSLGIDLREDPGLQLITMTEMQSIPTKKRSAVCTRLNDLTPSLCDSELTHADVLRVRHYRSRKVGFIALDLAVEPVVESERADITTLLEETGIDTSQDPFGRYRYQVVLGSCTELPKGVLKHELHDIINATHPKKVILGSPTTA